jgi:hypothetical protein
VVCLGSNPCDPFLLKREKAIARAMPKSLLSLPGESWHWFRIWGTMIFGFEFRTICSIYSSPQFLYSTNLATDDLPQLSVASVPNHRSHLSRIQLLLYLCQPLPPPPPFRRGHCNHRRLPSRNRRLRQRITR